MEETTILITNLPSFKLLNNSSMGAGGMAQVLKARLRTNNSNNNGNNNSIGLLAWLQ